MYDVIIIGAGPTGCTAAKVLGENGLKVLLVEKHKLPRYKSCSGVLIRKAMGLVERYFRESVPQAVMCTPYDNRGMVFTNDVGSEYRFEQEGLNVWRGPFDCWLAGKARESGAELRDGTAALNCEERDESIVVTLRGEKAYTQEARYVLDCEGVVGALKRRIVAEPQSYITTFQTFNKGSIDLDPHYFYAYLQPELSEYDAWFNVKDGLLVLGVSVKDPSKIAGYYAHFIAYMKDRHGLRIDVETRAEKWLMPRVRPGCPIEYGVGRMLFAGEIAGFLNPMGEGISAGMESGYYAARAVIEHFDDLRAIYDCYKRETEKLHNYMRRQWSFVGGMAKTFREMKI